MKLNENGFSYIELVVSLTIAALIAGAAAITSVQVLKGTGSNNDYITTVRQVQNAGFWISRDARMAQNVIAANLTPPNFLVMYWTEDYTDDPIYHSATYFFEDLDDGIGKLKRSHWSSAGANEELLVAQYLYYDPADPGKSCKASYSNRELTVELTALSGESRESREYKTNHRPNF